MTGLSRSWIPLAWHCRLKDTTSARRSRRSSYIHDSLEPGGQFDGINTGDPRALERFIKWAHDKYPKAERHLLVLSGHGSGITENLLLKDETSRDAMTPDDLERALARARARLATRKSSSNRNDTKKIDILGMDGPPGTGSIIRSGCSGFAYQHSYGISLYFPWSVVSPDYRKTKFARRTSWDKFLDLYVRKTAREDRFKDDGRRSEAFQGWPKGVRTGGPVGSYAN